MASIETLMEEVYPVVLQEVDVEIREMSHVFSTVNIFAELAACGRIRLKKNIY